MANFSLHPKQITASITETPNNTFNTRGKHAENTSNKGEWGSNEVIEIISCCAEKYSFLISTVMSLAFPQPVHWHLYKDKHYDKDSPGNN